MATTVVAPLSVPCTQQANLHPRAALFVRSGDVDSVRRLNAFEIGEMKLTDTRLVTKLVVLASLLAVANTTKSISTWIMAGKGGLGNRDLTEALEFFSAHHQVSHHRAQPHRPALVGRAHVPVPSQSAVRSASPRYPSPGTALAGQRTSRPLSLISRCVSSESTPTCSGEVSHSICASTSLHLVPYSLNSRCCCCMLQYS